MTLEPDVIEPLVEDYLDCECERVAAAAPAQVLLLLDPNELVPDLDDVDQLELLELAGHRSQITAAARACAICLVEGEHPLDHRQQRLRCWSGRGARALGSLLPLALLGSLLLHRSSPWDGIGRELGLGLQRFEHLERELQIARLAAKPLDVAPPRGDHVEELLDLRLLSLRDPAQLLDVLLAIQIERRDFLLIISRDRANEQHVEVIARPQSTHTISRKSSSIHVPSVAASSRALNLRARSIDVSRNR